MLKLIEDNDVFECIKLMNKSTIDNNYFGYDRNEAIWIEFFLSLVKRQKDKDPHVIVVGDYTINSKLNGFLTASTFSSYYTKEYVMDVKDCIVDHDNKGNGRVVYRLFDAMIDHVKKHGGKHWRADSIRGEEEAMKYGKFLQKRYNSQLHVSVRGVIE